MKNYSFADLIAPYSTDEFFRNYYEKSCLYIPRNDPSYFEDILTADDIDAFMQNKAIPASTIRMVRKGEEVTRSSFTRPGQGLVDNDRMFVLFADDITIVINGGDRSIPKLIRYASSIGAELGFNLQFNLYITPPNAQGFVAHYDDHDVFILQISGCKSWRLYHSPVVLPSAKQRHIRGKHKAGDPEHEIDLRPGDVLYIPRGFMHEATSSDATAIHITFGLHPAKAYELVYDLGRIAQDHPAFRCSIPHAFSSKSDLEIFKGTFKTLLRKLVDQVTTDQLLERKAEEFIAFQPLESTRRFTDISQLNRLNLDSVVARRDKVRFKVKKESDCLSVHFYGKRIPFPAFVQESLTLFQQNEPFSVRDIGGLIDDAGRIALAAKFVREGLLEIRALNAD